MRRFAYALGVFAAAAVVATAISHAAAQSRGKSERGQARAQEIRIGLGHGIAFLPLYLASDLKLFDKHARAAGLKGLISLRRFGSAAPMQEAVAKGEIEAGAYGLSALLIAREKSKGTPKEIVAVSGITTLPLVLLTARRDIKSLSDLKLKDRVAVPMLTAPQMTYLRIQSEKSAGLWDRLRSQVVAMPHQEAFDALTADKSEIAAYFSSPPFTQMAMKEPKVRAIFTSSDAIGGKSSFLVIASARDRLAAQPKLSEALSKAIDEAAAVIRNEPWRAAQIYLKYEPSYSLDVRAVEAILRELKDEFGSAVHGVEAMAAFMDRDGRLKNAPRSWKEVVAPALATGSGS